MGPDAETVAVVAVLFLEAVAVVLVLPAPTVVVVVFRDVVLPVLLLLAGGLRWRRGAPVFVLPELPVLTPALTAAVGLEVRNAPRTPSSSSCACAQTETPVMSAIKRGKTYSLKRIE
jgi:hypothetical protein